MQPNKQLGPNLTYKCYCGHGMEGCTNVSYWVQLFKYNKYKRPFGAQLNFNLT